MNIKQVFRGLTLLAIGLVVSLEASAYSYVKVTAADGTSATFALADKPTVTLTATSLVLTAGTQTVEYPATEYRSFSFTDEPTAISGLKADAQNPVFTLGDNLSGQGLEPGTEVAVYTIDGRLAGRASVAADGTATVGLNGLRGVMVVKSATKSFKFIRK